MHELSWRGMSLLFAEAWLSLVLLGHLRANGGSLGEDAWVPAALAGTLGGACAWRATGWVRLLAAGGSRWAIFGWITVPAWILLLAALGVAPASGAAPTPPLAGALLGGLLGGAAVRIAADARR